MLSLQHTTWRFQVERGSGFKSCHFNTACLGLACLVSAGFCVLSAYLPYACSCLLFGLLVVRLLLSGLEGLLCGFV